MWRAHAQRVGSLGNAVVSGDDSHLMTIAPTGAGKGRDVIIPNLLSYDGSVVVFDPKGENYDVTHRYRRDVLGHQVVLLDPFASSRTGSEHERRALRGETCKDMEFLIVRPDGARRIGLSS